MDAIDEYLTNVPEPQRGELERIRQIIHKALPDAVEVITYGMPGFKYKKKYLIAFASFKGHLSIFPGAGAVEKLQDMLSSYVLSKGTIQFQLENPLPEDLIKKIVMARASDITKI